MFNWDLIPQGTNVKQDVTGYGDEAVPNGKYYYMAPDGMNEWNNGFNYKKQAIDGLTVADVQAAMAGRSSGLGYQQIGTPPGADEGARASISDFYTTGNPNGWNKDWGNYFTFPERLAAKQADPKYVPDMQDYLAKYQWEAAKESQDFSTMDAPWAKHPEYTKIGQDQVIAPYQQALQQYNQTHGTNIQPSVTSVSQLPVSDYAAGDPTEHKPSQSIGALAKGAATSALAKIIALAATGGSAAGLLEGAGSALGEGMAFGGESALQGSSYLGADALGGGLGAGAEFGASTAPTIGSATGDTLASGSGPVYLDQLGYATGGGATGVPVMTAEQLAAAGLTPTQAAALYGTGTAASTSLSQLLQNQLTPQNLAQTAAGQALKSAGGTAANGNGIEPYPDLLGAGGNSGLSPTDTGGGSSTLTSAAQTSALQRILSGSASAADYLALGGSALTGLTGLIGADASRSANNAAADKMLALGQPARAAFDATLSPGWSYADSPDVKAASGQATSDMVRALSPKFGNVADSGSALGELLTSSINRNLGNVNQYRNTLTAAGSIGVPNANAPNLAAAGATNSGVAALGGAIGNATATNGTDLASLLRQLQMSNGGTTNNFYANNQLA